MSYIVGHPIKHPSDFYGRSHQVRRFFEIIGGTQAQSMSVLGLRRAGKTSFLQYVAHRDVISRYLVDPEKYVMVYLDVSSCKTPSDFYHRLLLRLKAALGDIQTVKLWKPSLAGETTMYDVEAYLCQFPERRIVLLLDEFDQLRTGSFDQDFLVELRAMTGVLDYDLACVTASYWDLYYLGSKIGLPPTSPFYNIFYPTPIYLSGFDEAECDSVIQQPARKMGSAFSAEDVQQIKAQAGTLPFFLQATAAQWMRRRQTAETVSANSVLRQLAADLAPYFDQWWRYFDDIHRVLLHSLALTEAPDQLPYGGIELSSALRHLQSYGLVVEKDGRFAVNGAVFTTWIRQYAELNAQKQDHLPAGDGLNGVAENGRVPTSRELRQILTHAFSLEELRNLCFDIGVDYDQLVGSEKGAKARSLVEYWQKRNDLGRLVEAIRFERGAIV